MVNIYLWRWRVERVHPLQDYVRLRHFDRDLRANGRLRRWNTGVTVDVNRGYRLTTMMQWTVHLVAATPVPMPLPAAPQHQVRGRFAILSPSLALHWNATLLDRLALHGTPIMDVSVLILARLPKKSDYCIAIFAFVLA
jgi:hypothetical protein